MIAIYEGNYTAVKSKMIQMFDLKTGEDILTDFRSFRQNNNEPVREFFVRFQLKVNEMLARGIWSEVHTTPRLLVQQFRQRIRIDLDTRVGDYCEDTNTEVENLNLDDFFQIVQRVEKRHSRDQHRPGLISAPLVKDAAEGQRKPAKCHYCGRDGHLIRNCIAKKKGLRPCQAHIDWGKKVFGENLKWYYKKSAVKARGAVAAVQTKEEPSQGEEIS